MKFTQLIANLAFAGSVAAIRSESDMYKFPAEKRQSLEIYPYPEVPSYNFSVPVDHFTASDTRTYNNRFFVNDTYYKPGGPVIVFDWGESGMSTSNVAAYFAEFEAVSAPIRLAERLNGLVIGWEHRYYGFSQPVSIDLEATTTDPYSAGLPSDGAAGYEYHTVEQALEDLVYFANRFNTTTLDLNSNVQSTENLDPYHTPWIMMGTSYPGVRSVWSRIRNPEVFYAAWASSAPVEARVDGSIYYNPIYRSLPSNCTADIKAAFSFIDGAFQSGSASINSIKAGVYLGKYYGTANVDISQAALWSEFDITSVMTGAISTGYQNYGAAHTAQYLCDYMNSFDAQAFFNSQASRSTNSFTYWDAVFKTDLLEYRPDGIAAAFGKDGPLAAFIAYQYGAYQSKLAQAQFFAQFTSKGGDDGYDREPVDSHAWRWQTLDQMGFFQGSNTSSEYNLGSKYANVSAVHESAKTEFPTFRNSDFPRDVNVTGPLSFGGWQMTPSNVMFTNGEFDPWRAFGVHSQEQVDAGAPERTTTQNVPACNKPPSGSDVFGRVYGGAVHGEDMVTFSRPSGSIDTVNTPLKQGLELFVSAWETWLPCFNQSRDDIRNGKGVDGQGNNASGSSNDDKANTAIRNAGRLGSLSAVAGLLSVLYIIL